MKQALPFFLITSQPPFFPELLLELQARIDTLEDANLKEKMKIAVRMGHFIQRHVVSIEALIARVVSNEDPASGTKWDAIHVGQNHESPDVATGFKTDADAILFFDRVLQTTQFQNFKMKAQEKFRKLDPNDPKIEVYSAGLHIPLSSLLDGRKADQHFLGVKVLEDGKTTQDVDFTGGRLTVEFVAEVHNGELKIRIDTMFPAEKRYEFMIYTINDEFLDNMETSEGNDWLQFLSKFPIDWKNLKFLKQDTEGETPKAFFSVVFNAGPPLTYCFYTSRIQ